METGTYILHENGFLAGNKKLVIRERKKHSTKPKFYLAQLEPFEYISSLFPVPTTSEEEFTFDYEKQLYSLRKMKNLVEIQKLE